MKKTIIKVIEKPKKPSFGDYEILYGLGIDNEKTIYELYFKDNNNKEIGELVSAKNTITGKNEKLENVVIRGLEKWQTKRK